MLTVSMPLRWIPSSGAITLLALFALGCGPKVHGSAQDNDSSLEVEDNLEERGQTPPAEPARSRTGSISRSALNRTLDAGVGAFLSTIEIEAESKGRHFLGWKLLAAPNPWVDLLPGDLVLSLNEQPLGSPEKVQALWSGLYQADEIRISASRAGELFELRYAIVGVTTSE